MSDLSSNNDAWFSKLRSHMDTESYVTTAATVKEPIHAGVCRHALFRQKSL